MLPSFTLAFWDLLTTSLVLLANGGKSLFRSTELYKAVFP